MADPFDDLQPSQDVPPTDLGRVEWLHGTLDKTTPEVAPRGRQRFPLFTCLTLVLGLFILGGLVWLLIGPPLPGAQVAAATATPTPDLAATALALATKEPTVTPYVPEPTPTPTPTRIGLFEIGDRVIISGTGSRGLRLRAGPGLDYLTQGLAKDGSVFFIMPGNGNEETYPVKADDYVWWRLRSPDGKIGWTVQNYLAPAPLITPTATVAPTP